MKNSIIALSLSLGLGGGVGTWAAVSASPGNSALRMDDDYRHFPHMHRALDRLREARHELEEAEDIFKDHKAEALDHVDKAIEQVKDGLEEQGEKTDAVVGQPAAKGMDDDHYPHLARALEGLHHAQDELGKADDIFKGHRERAMDQVDRAIHQIEDAIRVG